MNRLSNLKPRELIRALEKLGFIRMRKSKGLLVKIIKIDLEMNVEDFVSFLK